VRIPVAEASRYGILQVDGYGGFKRLAGDGPNGPARLAFCWSHCRRYFYDCHQATKSPLAFEALQQIGRLYAIEEPIRGCPAEDRHRDLDPRFLLVDLLDDAVERGERSVGDAHLLADLEGDRRLRPLDPLLDLAHDPRRLVLADRRRAAAAAEKAGDLGGVLDEVPGRVVEVHLDQHIAGKEFALGTDLGAALDLDDLLGRHQDLLEALGHALLLGLLADRGRHLLLKAGVDVDHVPVARHASVLRYCPSPKSARTP
jgi:hypothetical protein